MNNDDFKFLVNKMDNVDSKLDAQGQTLTRAVVSLEHHVKRTDLLEEDMQNHRAQIAKELKPLKRAYNLAAASAIIMAGLVSALRLLHELGLF